MRVEVLSSADKGARFVSIFRQNIAAVADDSMGQIAFWVAGELKKRISKQQFNHRPLSKRYLDYKKNMRLDTRVLMATGDYLNSIQARRKMYKGDFVWSVGVPDSIHGPSGLPYTQLARILEFGSMQQKIPPRPHWRPVWSIVTRVTAGLTMIESFAQSIAGASTQTGGHVKHPDPVTKTYITKAQQSRK